MNLKGRPSSLRLDAAARKQIPDTAKVRGISEQQVISDVLLKAQPTKQFVTID